MEVILLPAFSEFSYGFAFTHEYISRHPGLKVAPELPSLVKEGQPGGGWDLKLGYRGHPKFFQFKLSEYMKGGRSLHWEHFKEPHYRFRITPQNQSEQHNLLKDLANDYQDVNYVAPRFHTQQRFDELFRNGLVTTHSIWVPARDLPHINDGDRHYLTFTAAQREAFWQSEPTRLEGGFAAEDHYARVNERRVIDEGFFRELRQNLFTRMRNRTAMGAREPELADDLATVLEDTHRLLTTPFGLSMVILAEI